MNRTLANGSRVKRAPKTCCHDSGCQARRCGSDHPAPYRRRSRIARGSSALPPRVAKAYEFLTSGYAQDPKEAINGALFTEEDYQEMILCKDLDFYSLCEHHLLPFMGKAHVAYLPNRKIVGLSKLARLVEIYARRLQVQERLTTQIAQTLMRRSTRSASPWCSRPSICACGCAESRSRIPTSRRRRCWAYSAPITKRATSSCNCSATASRKAKHESERVRVNTQAFTTRKPRWRSKGSKSRSAMKKFMVLDDAKSRDDRVDCAAGRHAASPQRAMITRGGDRDFMATHWTKFESGENSLHTQKSASEATPCSTSVMIKSPMTS